MTNLTSRKYDFTPLTESDFPKLYKWVCSPHVLKWWDKKTDFESFCQKYRENIANPLVFPFLVSVNKQQIGYIQYWFVEEDGDFRDRYPQSTVGIDQFIGESDHLGQKHGTFFVREFSNHLLTKDNIDLVITDPDPQNTIAIKCYENAGFKTTEEIKTSDGVVLLMEKEGML